MVTWTQVCSRCGNWKPADQFAPSAQRNGRQCRACRAEVSRDNYTPEKRRRSNLKFKFNISPEDYDEMLCEQNNRCAICGTDEPGRSGVEFFHVDHDHETGRVRGLLCQGCNTGIGNLKEDIFVLESAIVYLQQRN